MSYDVYIHDSKYGMELFERNHTSNTSAMWRTQGVDLRSFHGVSAINLAVPLTRVLANLRDHPEDFRQFEPDNGWGSLKSTVEFLSEILTACYAYPDEPLYVSA